MYLILKNLWEYNFDKRNILEWGFEQGWRKNFRLFSPSRSLRRYRLQNRGTFAEALSAKRKRKNRLLGNPVRPCTSYAYNPIEEKYRNISLLLNLLRSRKSSKLFHGHVHKDDYLYPIWDFIVSIIAKEKEKKRENVKFRASSE